jgi:hypothetical protein
MPVPQDLVDQLITDLDLPDDIMYLQRNGDTIIYRQKPDEPMEAVGRLSDSGDGLLCNIYDREIYEMFAILEKRAKRRYGTKLTVRLVEPEPADD